MYIFKGNLNMSELKTVEHEGKVYQIGAVYCFRRATSSKLYVDVLSRITEGEQPFESHTDYWDEALELQYPIGTITDAPLELEDGEWYMCDTALVGNACLKFCKADSSRADTWFNGKDCFKVGEHNEKLGVITPKYKMIKA